MTDVKNESGGVLFVKDVLSTFGDPSLISRIIIEQGRLHFDCKGYLGTQPVVAGKKFMSLSIGEYNIIHAGIGNVIVALTDKDEGIDLKTLVTQCGQQIIDLTDGYYFDFMVGRPKPYVFQLARNTLRKMTKYGLVDLRGDKYYRTSMDADDFVAQLYGRALNNPNGKSSFYRVMVIAVVGVEGGIGADFVPQRLQELHKITNLKSLHLEKVLDIHGREGSGYILRDIGGRLWRMYERINQHPSTTLSILQENQKLLEVITKTPCISQTQIYEIFGPQIAQQLYVETQEIQPNFATSIVVRRGDMYLTGSHVKSLKLRNCEPENNPVLALVRDLYSQFSPSDCTSVSFYAREVVHDLYNNGQYKPQNEKERRILHFLQKRKLVESEPFGNDIYFPSNRPMIKQLSWVLGNIID